MIIERSAVIMANGMTLIVYANYLDVIDSVESSYQNNVVMEYFEEEGGLVTINMRNVIYVREIPPLEVDE